MRVELGQPVSSPEGHLIGVIRYFTLDPTSGQARAVGVEQGALLSHRLEAPLEAFVEGQEGLCLTLTPEQIQLPSRFDENRYQLAHVGPNALHQENPLSRLLWPAAYTAAFLTDGVPGNVRASGAGAGAPTDASAARFRSGWIEDAAISAGDAVCSLDGKRVGRVANIVFDADTGFPTAMVVRRGWVFVEDLTYLGDTIARIDDGVVYLKMEKGRLLA